MTETISSPTGRVCVLVRARRPEETTFYTPPETALQVGHIVHPAGHEIPRHFHRPRVRKILKTSEVLVVQRGRCVLDLFDDDGAPLTSRELGEGDVVVLLGGGHAFRMTEDTVLLEVKQGPYPGPDEKVSF